MGNIDIDEVRNCTQIMMDAMCQSFVHHNLSYEYEKGGPSIRVVGGLGNYVADPVCEVVVQKICTSTHPEHTIEAIKGLARAWVFAPSPYSFTKGDTRVTPKEQIQEYLRIFKRALDEYDAIYATAPSLPLEVKVAVLNEISSHPNYLNYGATFDGKYFFKAMLPTSFGDLLTSMEKAVQDLDSFHDKTWIGQQAVKMWYNTEWHKPKEEDSRTSNRDYLIYVWEASLEHAITMSQSLHTSLAKVMEQDVQSTSSKKKRKP